MPQRISRMRGPGYPPSSGGSTPPPIEQYVDIPGPYTTDLPAVAYTYGMKCRFAKPGRVVGIRNFIGSPGGSPAAWKFSLWQMNGLPMAQTPGAAFTADAFNNIYFASPVDVLANTTYMVSFFMDAAGERVYIPLAGLPFAGQSSGDVRLLGQDEDGDQGFYIGVDAFPSTWWNGAILPVSPIFVANLRGA